MGLDDVDTGPIRIWFSNHLRAGRVSGANQRGKILGLFEFSDCRGVVKYEASLLLRLFRCLSGREYSDVARPIKANLPQ
jgi:hypothetical protein